MERKQEEQARQMHELQDCAERLQRENDQLQSQVVELGKDVQERDRAEPPIVCNKGKEPVIFGDCDALIDDKLSSGRSSSMSPPPGKNARGSIRAKS